MRGLQDPQNSRTPRTPGPPELQDPQNSRTPRTPGPPARIPRTPGPPGYADLRLSRHPTFYPAMNTLLSHSHPEKGPPVGRTFRYPLAQKQHFTLQ
ncbi:hypothetical protein FOCC_FOCC008838 [Frankliniella occidentalis]|nr:hypothetical protein FOCC_FOCC008838 [Frankliniella occidentalis]